MRKALESILAGILTALLVAVVVAVMAAMLFGAVALIVFSARVIRG